MTRLRWLLLLGAILIAITANAQLYSPFDMYEGLIVSYDAARGWHGGDVNLTFVNANYVQATHEQIDIATGDSYNWVYQYYEPRLDTTIVVVVRKYSAGGFYSYPRAIYLPITQAKFDSARIDHYMVAPDSAILTMRNSGLSEFINAHPDFIALRYEGRGRTQAWTGIFVSGDDTLTCRVDLYSGQSYGCAENTVSGIHSIGDRQGVELYPVSPNPISMLVTPEVVVTFEAASSSLANFFIYDIRGRQVITLGELDVHPGTNILRVSTEKLGIPGTYFAVLKMHDHISSQKIIVID